MMLMRDNGQQRTTLVPPQSTSKNATDNDFAYARRLAPHWMSVGQYGCHIGITIVQCDSFTPHILQAKHRVGKF
jgi:hypothetical protein